MTDKPPHTTTDAGTPVASDEFSLTVGPDGPILLQDQYLIEQMANFNRERIPERQPHAKGSGAFGELTVTQDITQYTRARLFEALEAKGGSAVDRAQALLKLTMGGFFTEGKLAAKAREMILGHLATPGFLTGYFAAQSGADNETAMAGLMADLDKAGINAETGLKSIAA